MRQANQACAGCRLRAARSSKKKGRIVASTTPCGCPAIDRCRWVGGQVEADMRCLELGLHAYVVMEDGAPFDWAALGETTDECDES